MEQVDRSILKRYNFAGKDALTRYVRCVETGERHSLGRWAEVIAHARTTPKKHVIATLRGRCNSAKPAPAYGFTWRWAS